MELVCSIPYPITYLLAERTHLYFVIAARIHDVGIETSRLQFLSSACAFDFCLKALSALCKAYPLRKKAFPASGGKPQPFVYLRRDFRLPSYR